MAAIRTIIEAANELGTSRKVVGELVRILGIVTVPVPRNGNAKGLDESAMRRLRTALGQTKRRPA